jgi:hypothetical protein
MKKMKQMIAAIAVGLVCVSNYAMASTTINFDGGYFTSSGSNIGSGVLFFISNGGNGAFDSGTWSNGSTSFINSDDRLIGFVNISNGVGAGSFTIDYTVPGVAANQKITGLFVNGDVSSVANLNTGALTGGNTFLSSGGTAFSFGSYRTDTLETFKGGTTSSEATAWIVPADGNTLAMNAVTISYNGANTDIDAALATTGTLNIGDLSANPIPEPSVASLLALGTVGLVALRVRRKS